MFSNRIYSTIIWNLMISGLLSTGYQAIEAQIIEQDRDYILVQSKRALNGINQKSSAEYNFFLMVFGLAHRAQRAQGVSPVEHGSARFVEQVAKVARTKKKPDVIVFDQVVNGKGPGIDWTEVNPAYIDYRRALDSVNRMVDEMTRNQSTRLSEVKRLREFSQGVVDYRSNLPISAGQAPTIARWKSIVSKLDEVLSEPARFRTWSDEPEIDLYYFPHEYESDFALFEQGPSIFFNFKSIL